LKIAIINRKSKPKISVQLSVEIAIPNQLHQRSGYYIGGSVASVSLYAVILLTRKQLRGFELTLFSRAGSFAGFQAEHSCHA
jgi:hypothetical protein